MTGICLTGRLGHCFHLAQYYPMQVKAENAAGSNLHFVYRHSICNMIYYDDRSCTSMQKIGGIYMFKRFLSLVLVCLCVSSYACTMESRPVRRFDVIQNEHDLVQVMLTYSEDNAAASLFSLAAAPSALTRCNRTPFTGTVRSEKLNFVGFKNPSKFY